MEKFGRWHAKLAKQQYYLKQRFAQGLRKGRYSRYSLKNLMRGHKRKAPVPPDVQAFISMQPVGMEII